MCCTITKTPALMLFSMVEYIDSLSTKMLNNLFLDTENVCKTKTTKENGIKAE